MSLRSITRNPFHSCLAIILLLIFAGPAGAQTENPAASAKKLTVERIYSEPGLSGRTLRGITWTPDGKQVSFLEAKGSSAEGDAEDGVENKHQGKQKKENN